MICRSDDFRPAKSLWRKFYYQLTGRKNNLKLSSSQNITWGKRYSLCCISNPVIKREYYDTVNAEDEVNAELPYINGVTQNKDKNFGIKRCFNGVCMLEYCLVINCNISSLLDYLKCVPNQSYLIDLPLKCAVYGTLTLLTFWRRRGSGLPPETTGNLTSLFFI